MNFALQSKIENEAVEMRAAFNTRLMELAQVNRNIVLFQADLSVAIGTQPFAQRFPERMVECGIQEANMIGMAAGLSVLGKIPFAHSFAPFVTRRACDQIFISGAYAKLNVKLIGSDPGVTAAFNGGTHMPFEDMGIMRCIPGMTLLEPVDSVMLADLMEKICGQYGMHYMRLHRKCVPGIFKPGATFDIGKMVPLAQGEDVTLIASGICTAEALKAAAILAGEGISASVLNAFTWKPIDAHAIVQAAERTGAIVTAENHNVIGGLGSAVSEVLCKAKPVPVEMIGVQDEFGEVGPEEYLRERFGLTAAHIVRAAKAAVIRKRSA